MVKSISIMEKYFLKFITARRSNILLQIISVYINDILLKLLVSIKAKFC